MATYALYSALSQTFNMLWVSLVGYISAVCSMFQGYMFGKSGELLTMRLRRQVFHAMMRQVG